MPFMERGTMVLEDPARRAPDLQEPESLLLKGEGMCVTDH
jgi:hypothetical protein